MARSLNLDWSTLVGSGLIRKQYTRTEVLAMDKRYSLLGAGKTTYIVSAGFRFFPLFFLLPTYPDLT